MQDTAKYCLSFGYGSCDHVELVQCVQFQCQQNDLTLKNFSQVEILARSAKTMSGNRSQSNGAGLSETLKTDK